MQPHYIEKFGAPSTSTNVGTGLLFIVAKLSMFFSRREQWWMCFNRFIMIQKKIRIRVTVSVNAVAASVVEISLGSRFEDIGRSAV